MSFLSLCRRFELFAFVLVLVLLDDVGPLLFFIHAGIVAAVVPRPRPTLLPTELLVEVAFVPRPLPLEEEVFDVEGGPAVSDDRELVIHEGKFKFLPLPLPLPLPTPCVGGGCSGCDDAGGGGPLLSSKP